MIRSMQFKWENAKGIGLDNVFVSMRIHYHPTHIYYFYRCYGQRKEA